MNDPAVQRDDANGLSSVVSQRNAAAVRSADERERELRVRRDESNKRHTTAVAYDIPPLALGRRPARMSGTGPQKKDYLNRLKAEGLPAALDAALWVAKDLMKRLRRGIPGDKRERAALYGDALVIVNAFYPDGGALWKTTVAGLPTLGKKDTGSQDLLQAAVGTSIKKLLGDDRTRNYGLLLLQRAAKLSGSLNINYLPMLRALSDAFDYQLHVATGSVGRWDLINITDDGALAVRPSA